MRHKSRIMMNPLQRRSQVMADNPATVQRARGRMNPKVDWYFTKHEKWEHALRKLRAIALGCRLTEELKWGCPCYTESGSNIVLIHAFKEYCALLFFKGALLEDDQRILVQQTKNVQSARQIRFTSAGDVARIERVVKDYILEAIAVENSGARLERKTTAEFDLPEEFAAKLEEFPDLNRAFDALTPGRQRGYLLHFSSAKQSKTRAARVEKCMPRILDGKGLDD
jgi:uncharacterized protein YdeI (YjbR/CyaY-like superfamily)